MRNGLFVVVRFIARSLSVNSTQSQKSGFGDLSHKKDSQQSTIGANKRSKGEVFAWVFSPGNPTSRMGRQILGNPTDVAPTGFGV